MINSVRQTVMSVLNKNNYGYISPSDFNLFAKQAQLDMFENYFYQYNYQLVKENARHSGTGYADITKGLEETIDYFSVTLPLTNSSFNKYFLPSDTTTGTDYYLINKLLIYRSELVTGSTTSFIVAGDTIIDATKDFIALGISNGDIVGVAAGGVTYNMTVISVLSATQILVNTGGDDIFDAAPIVYHIYSSSFIKEAEKVTHSKITMLNNSLLTAPTLTYPAYTQEDLLATAFPSTVDGIGQVVAQYIRYPYIPKWTYVSIGSGEPIFDASQPDYQDFELPIGDEVNLVNKILQYAGMSIREIEVANFGNTEDNEDNTQKR